ncbi:SMI1/KNR4 family protein [Streptomyces sp. NBC_00269]|uniref:SMI1/KNR4 family protein n=1 Tax=Streptomyces sp. NBC_00269 TaxID=2975696 RepID=UPI003FA6E0B8
MANEIAADVVGAWDEIERWYEAQGAAHLILPPASGEQIAALEATLGVELPGAVTASLRRHNGSTDGGWPTGTLLSCDGILQRRGRECRSPARRVPADPSFSR